MLPTNSVPFVSLSDAMKHMGYSHKMDEVHEIFSKVSWGDATHTIVTTEWFTNCLFRWLNDPSDQTWTDTQKMRFYERADELTANHTYVDMEN